ncbi:1-deoxy-D-xylulose-5-phosphate reductoisomerase [Acinetobacter sp. B5B]|uniref:1-deoxy-D-xylulose-5-phosphate reductoisomerase n=1 Tax=Acinetobacter baretiae TaxID=2605383 RepID=UPI0018C2EB02|nr:1-deoxy-D-xylulose-5-phosphate reductoisomerase [Acinetobacter baretiae]MBF7682488.1 1-deoxy-D-xylulose-5-phosphate reductoisomerase [Acinetobacter baretiae]MBF7685245.1 1-deoxy-D-xylulose-5-phosphate reductoisomerase [Acinetobacter baretiae]
MRQNVCILGATGSIGDSTLKVLAQHAEHYAVFAVTGYHRIDKLIEICIEHRPKVVVVPQNKQQETWQKLQQHGLSNIEILTDEQGLVHVSSHADVDVVMAAIVGAAGLLPTLAAVRAGKRVLLANKEALVMSGDIMMQEAQKNNALLLPVDSEHNAIFQCLPHDYNISKNSTPLKQGISQVLLTASGGPFLHTPADELIKVTPAQACKHPNWSMGRKISVDSATLMNKGLELIEACHLFNICESYVTVVVHPQSIIHSMVQYIDGSTLAQMGNPDMCTPIAHALAWPQRIHTPVPALDLFVNHQLDFQPPDTQRFPALQLAREAIKEGGVMPTILNAANEIAVDAFLNEKIKFTDISKVIDYVLNATSNVAANDLEVILSHDILARRTANTYIQRKGQ